jgi:hypothetical protein
MAIHRSTPFKLAKLRPPIVELTEAVVALTILAATAVLASWCSR